MYPNYDDLISLFEGQNIQQNTSYYNHHRVLLVKCQCGKWSDLNMTVTTTDFKKSLSLLKPLQFFASYPNSINSNSNYLWVPINWAHKHINWALRMYVH